MSGLNKEIDSIAEAALDSPEKFQELKDIFKKSPEEAWSKMAKNLHWDSGWDKVSNEDFVNGKFSWFENGTINACYNCLDRHAKETPDKLAIVWATEASDKKRYLTYQHLYKQVCKFTNAIKSYGLTEKDSVCIYMPMIPEAIIAMLACARAGLTHSVVFGGFSPEALASRIIDANAKLLITADQTIRSGKILAMKELADKALEQAPLDHVIVVKNIGKEVNMHPDRDHWYHEIESEASDDCPYTPVESEHPLFVLYTSGSTGKPKGIVHSTGGYLTYASATFKYIFNYKEGDIYWCTADIGWITGHSYIVYGPMANGATNFIFEGNPMFPTVDNLGKIIDEFKINILYTAPTLIRMIMSYGDNAIAGSTRSSLKTLGTVGEPINPAAWQWYFEKIGNSKCPVIDTWWQTETGGVMIAPRHNKPQIPGSAMEPFLGIDAVIIDQDGNELSGKCEGLLAIKGTWPGMMRTIYNDHERFLDTYLKAFPGYYLTGDGAKRDKNGNIWITGRVDDVVNVSGHRISTAEVESVLVANKHVAEAAVVGCDDEIKGQALYAFVILMHENFEPTKEFINTLCKEVSQTIGSFAKPKHIQIVENLPKTRSGKIMRRILRNLVHNNFDNLGDLSTLSEPQAIKAISQSIEV